MDLPSLQSRCLFRLFAGSNQRVAFLVNCESEATLTGCQERAPPTRDSREEASESTLDRMNQQPIPQLRLKPGRLGRHDLISVGDGQEVIQQGGRLEIDQKDLEVYGAKVCMDVDVQQTVSAPPYLLGFTDMSHARWTRSWKAN